MAWSVLLSQLAGRRRRISSAMVLLKAMQRMSSAGRASAIWVRVKVLPQPARATMARLSRLSRVASIIAACSSVRFMLEIQFYVKGRAGVTTVPVGYVSFVGFTGTLVVEAHEGEKVFKCIDNAYEVLSAGIDFNSVGGLPLD